MSDVFGFHTIDENLFTLNDYSFTETYYDTQNFLNVIGWIPLFGTIVGCIRIGSTAAMWVGDNKSHRSRHRKYFAVSGLRGAIETLSLGWVFIIPDLVVTSSEKRRFKKGIAFKKKLRLKRKGNGQ
jgi:hypothetical protein